MPQLDVHSKSSPKEHQRFWNRRSIAWSCMSYQPLRRPWCYYSRICSAPSLNRTPNKRSLSIYVQKSAGTLKRDNCSENCLQQDGFINHYARETARRCPKINYTLTRTPVLVYRLEKYKQDGLYSILDMSWEDVVVLTPRGGSEVLECCCKTLY